MAIYYDGYDWDSDGFPGEYVYGDDEYVDDYYMDERWKRMPGAQDYWISNKERVWSSHKQNFIDGSLTMRGYTDFSLRCNGHRIHKTLHKAMAEAFIPNPNNYREVRHLDDDPTNNELGNLAWGTQHDNVQDCIRNGHFRYFSKEDIEKANAARRTPIIAVRLKDGEKLYFASQQEAGRQLGIDQSSINAVIRGKSRSAYGYFFSKQDHFDESFNYHDYPYQRKGMSVKAINLDTGEIRIYDRPRQAALDLNMSEASVSNVLRGKARSAKGWVFETLDTEEKDNGRIY